MTFGVSLFLIALGAILVWGVTATLAGVSINTIGIVLLVVGLAGLLFAALTHAAGGHRTRRLE